MRRPISQTLSNDACDGTLCALYIIYGQPNAVAITEIALGGMSVQVFFLAVLTHTLHAALEHRIVVLSGVAVSVAAWLTISWLATLNLPRR